MTQLVAIAGESPARPPGRYLFVDGLRGVAAVLVVLHHLLIGSVLEVTFRRVLPSWFAALCTFGNRGVEVFFVLSGFVIAHSLRSIVPDARGSLNFILRRQLRLDPPYLVLLVLTLVDTAVENHLPGLVHKPAPNAVDVAANVAYLQHLTGRLPIVVVGWTLCLEVQFYLLFMFATAVGYRALPTRANPSRVAIALVVGSGLACLTAVRHQWVFAAWFCPFWPYFVLGVACYWATHRVAPRWSFAGYAAAFAAATLVFAPYFLPEMLTGLATAGLLYVAAETGRLRTWGRNPALQYLGRTSYSLYLVHFVLVSAILRGGYKLTGENRPAAVVWLVLAAGVSFAAAAVFHRLVEVPSMRWSARLKPRRTAAAGEAAAAAEVEPSPAAAAVVTPA